MSDGDLTVFYLAIGRWNGLPIGPKTFNVEDNRFADEG